MAYSVYCIENKTNTLLANFTTYRRSVICHGRTNNNVDQAKCGIISYSLASCFVTGAIQIV